MTKYVLGFAFDNDGNNVALIRKTKPAWQAGKYNGIGGKIEAFESGLEAMVREFWEEAGVMTLSANWQKFAEISGPDWHCECFYTFNTFIITKCRTVTEELVEVLSIVRKTESGSPVTISNLSWLIPAAINHRQNCGEFFLEAKYQ